MRLDTELDIGTDVESALSVRLGEVPDSRECPRAGRFGFYCCTISVGLFLGAICFNFDAEWNPSHLMLAVSVIISLLAYNHLSVKHSLLIRAMGEREKALQARHTKIVNAVNDSIASLREGRAPGNNSIWQSQMDAPPLNIPQEPLTVEKRLR